MARSFTKFLTVLFALGLTLCGTSHAQSIWTKTGIGMNVYKDLSINAEAIYRTHDKLCPTYRCAGAFSLDYKPVKYLKTSIGYSYIHEQNKEKTDDGGITTIPAYWQPRHRFFTDLTGSYGWKGLKLSLRERYQYTYNTANQTGDIFINPKGKHMLLSRLQIQYDIAGTGLAPYMSAQIYNELAEGFNNDKYRLAAGLGWSFCKLHNLKLYYMFEDFTKSGRTDNHIIGIEYKIKLDLRKKK